MIHNKNILLLIKVLGIPVAVYLSFKFLMPLIWPVAAGFFISRMLLPVTRILMKKFHVGKSVSVYITILLFMAVTGIVSLFLGRMAFDQIKNLLVRWDIIIPKADLEMKKICCNLETGFNIP